MISSIIEKIGTLFNNLALPGEIVEVFNMFGTLWDSIPYAVRYVFIGIFSVAITFAALKMLF